MNKTRIYVGLGVIVVAVLAWMIYPDGALPETMAHTKAETKEEGRARPEAAKPSMGESLAREPIADRQS